MKKLCSILMIAAMLVAVLAGCSTQPAADSQKPSTGNTASSQKDESAAPSGNGASSLSGSISVVSREEGSGTRGAFIELFGIEQKDADGKKVDHTTDAAEITNSTSVMMTTVAGNTSAIGYISLGSLNNTVKALQIDGTDATVDNIKSGSYKVARPFNIATQATVSDLAQDFIDFIMSEEGQAVVEENGYISQGNTGAFAGTKPSGKLVVAGSSSVTPVMEKLKEAYCALNTDASIEIQQSDSTTGMTSAIEGVCDIGMASRDLKDSEKEAGLSSTVIAMDGIAVIVNNENPLQGLTSQQVQDIFTGAVTDWSELG